MNKVKQFESDVRDKAKAITDEHVRLDITSILKPIVATIATDPQVRHQYHTAFQDIADLKTEMSKKKWTFEGAEGSEGVRVLVVSMKLMVGLTDRHQVLGKFQGHCLWVINGRIPVHEQYVIRTIATEELQA